MFWNHLTAANHDLLNFQCFFVILESMFHWMNGWITGNDSRTQQSLPQLFNTEKMVCYYSAVVTDGLMMGRTSQKVQSMTRQTWWSDVGVTAGWQPQYSRFSEAAGLVSSAWRSQAQTKPIWGHRGGTQRVLSSLVAFIDRLHSLDAWCQKGFKKPNT